VTGLEAGRSSFRFELPDLVLGGLNLGRTRHDWVECCMHLPGLFSC
jgi:hypothetical protein